MKKIFLVVLLAMSFLLTSCNSHVPFIGENGNWWVDDKDLGVPAQGPQGEQGEQGEQGKPGEPGEPGTESGHGEDGKPGHDGNDGESVTVESVKKTDTVGSIDTYTIYLSDNTTKTFTVKNGTDGQKIRIVSVEKESTSGLIDKYKITFSDKSTYQFQVKNAEDGTCITILSIGKTDSEGAIDTYTIEFSDGTKTIFTVMNGKDGNSPYVGPNGNWWIGSEDTGITAEVQDMDRKGTDGLIFRTTIRGGVVGYEVYGYKGDEKNIVIPNYLYNKPVVSIAPKALPENITSLSISSNTQYLCSFEDYNDLKSVDFNHAPVSTLPDLAFCSCDNLRSVQDYEHVKIIGQEAFYGTQLTDFDFTNVTEIHESAFYDCPMTDPDDCVFIHDQIFIYLPETVTVIESGAFGSYNMPIYYAGTEIETVSGCHFYNGVRTTEDGYYYTVHEDKKSVSVLNYDGEQSEIVIPSRIEKKPVTDIASGAFYGNGKVERVEIPSSVETIGKYTFSLCRRLHSVFIPESVTSCGNFDQNFTNSKWTELERLTVFFESNSLDYPNGVTSPEDLDLTKYMVGVKPSDIVSDEHCVYIKKALSYEVVTIRNTKGTATVPAKYKGLPVKRINMYAVYGDTMISAVQIEEGVQKISTKAFCDSDTLMFVNVPKSIEAVNHYGFYDLPACTLGICAAKIPADWDSNWYYDIYEYHMNTEAHFSQDGKYLYRATDSKVYLMKYLWPIETGKPVLIPEKIDGKPVYGICEYCYMYRGSTSSSDRCIFVVPNTITVMEDSAIYMAGNSDYRGYSELYMGFESKDKIPSTWSDQWFYTSYYGYHFDSGYNHVYYADDWKLVDGVPTVK